MTPLPVIPFTTEKIRGCTIAADVGANIATWNPTSSFYVSCFTASVTPSINTPESFKDFMILMISSLFSFEMNKVNLLPALTTLFPLILLSTLFFVFEAMLLINPGKHL